MGALEQAHMVVHRAGERAALVAEQLTPEQRVCESGAIGRNERPVFSSAGIVQRPGDEFFSRSRFSLNEYRGVDSCHIANQLVDIQHGCAAPDQIMEVGLLVELPAKMMDIGPVVQQDNAAGGVARIVMNVAGDPACRQFCETDCSGGPLSSRQRGVLPDLFPFRWRNRKSLFPRPSDDRFNRMSEPLEASRRYVGKMAGFVDEQGGKVEMVEEREDVVSFLLGLCELAGQAGLSPAMGCLGRLVLETLVTGSLQEIAGLLEALRDLFDEQEWFLSDGDGRGFEMMRDHAVIELSPQA